MGSGRGDGSWILGYEIWDLNFGIGKFFWTWDEPWVGWRGGNGKGWDDGDGNGGWVVVWVFGMGKWGFGGAGG